jgi:transposase-like protein
MRRKDYDLTPKQDQALQLVLANHTHHSAARAMGMARKNLQRLLERAVERLRRLKSRPPPHTR